MVSGNAGGIAMRASTMLNRVSTLVYVGYGEELDNDLRSSLVNHEQSSFTDPQNTTQGEYKIEEDGILNRRGRK